VENVDVLIWMGGKTRDPDHVGEETATALFVFTRFGFYESLVDSLLKFAFETLRFSPSCFLHSMRLIRAKQVGVGATAAGCSTGLVCRITKEKNNPKNHP
jgi:hypothetical protein